MPPARIQGIITPIVTPLIDGDTLDVPGLERLIEHLIGGGISGIFVLGTTGEGPSLSGRLRREMLATSARLIHGRIPFFAGITDTSLSEARDLARLAADAGAAAAVAAPPYYFPIGQTELRCWVHQLIDQLPLPLILYNIPALTKVGFGIETIEHFVDSEHIVGVKDSSGDLDYFQALLKLRDRRPDWTVFIGPEHLLVKSVLMGGDGGVNGGSNIFPELFAKAFRAAQTKDTDTAKALESTINQFQAIYETSELPSRFLTSTKCALSILGICTDFVASPLQAYQSEERIRIEAILTRIQNSLPLCNES